MSIYLKSREDKLNINQIKSKASVAPKSLLHVLNQGVSHMCVSLHTINYLNIERM